MDENGIYIHVFSVEEMCAWVTVLGKHDMDYMMITKRNHHDRIRYDVYIECCDNGKMEELMHEVYKTKIMV